MIDTSGHRRMPVCPPRLPRGGTLGVIATSTPITAGGEELVERGYRRLRERGFEVVEATNARLQHGHAAGTIAARVGALHALFVDDDIDGIIAFWGGMQTHQLLEHLDWDLLAAHPKPLVGYSDLTALTSVVTDRTGLVTFSGPAVITFAKPKLFEYSWRWFERVLVEGGARLSYEPAGLCSDNLWYEREDRQMLERPAPGWRCYRGGEARGPIMGGNLGTLLHLAGTPYWPDMRGRILFVEEDEDESPASIDRMFTQLRHMGVFDQIAGLVVGRIPSCVGFSEEDSFEMLLDDALAGYDLPVLLDVDFGHTDPLVTFPLGVQCHLSADRAELELVEPWLT
jgi:muramoyltetrapeptide carboxypeptidase